MHSQPIGRQQAVAPFFASSSTLYPRLRTAASVAAAVIVVIYFWRFTHVALRTGFGHDDLMNLFFVWRESLTDVFKANLFFRTNVVRPFGALFYTTFFHLFGFDGLPFRIFMYAVLWANVGLTFVFVRRAVNSPEIALLTVLLHCYQANFFPLYYGSGSCYDVFAFFFYYAAFALALRGKQKNRNLNVAECIGVAILFACAVNSKEAAASLPVTLLIYELLYNPPRSWSWIWRDARAILITGCIGLLFLWSRFTGPNNLLGHPAYAPVISVSQYLQATSNYLNELTGYETLWTPDRAGFLLLALSGIALLMRSRDLWFAWLLVVVGAAPIAFVQPRGVSAYYIAIVGYVLFGSILLVRAREFLMRNRASLSVLASQAALFVFVFTLLWRWQLHNQRRIPEHWEQLALIESTASQFRSHPDWFRSGSRVLIYNDPFTEYEWASSFIAFLVTNDKSINVAAWAKLEPKPGREQIEWYTRVIGYLDGRYIEIDRDSIRP